MAQIAQRIGFIGAGNMGEAMIGAIIGSGLFAPQRVAICDINPERLNLLQKTYCVTVETDPASLFAASDLIVLAVKPQQIPEILTAIAGAAANTPTRKRVISIAAGVRLEKIEKTLYAGLNDHQRKRLPIIRVMPNTPALVLAGMSGMSPNSCCEPEDLELTRRILAAMGKVYDCPEASLDAVTAVSGSGPAYIFYFIEAMIEGAIGAGLPPQDAERLTLATFEGALKLIAERGEPAEALRKKVTSPGGTTEAALKVMHTAEVKRAIAEAVQAAALRSIELSRLS